MKTFNSTAHYEVTIQSIFPLTNYLFVVELEQYCKIHKKALYPRKHSVFYNLLTVSLYHEVAFLMTSSRFQKVEK